MEERNLPTVTLVNYGFVNDAMSASSVKGIPNMRIVSETVPSECTVKEDIEDSINSAWDRVLDALTKPLTTEEKSPLQRKMETPSRIIFKGNVEEVNHFFYRRGWTDGLPVLPPTETSVAEMLKGTDLEPDHELGELIPRMGKVTIEKIAVNAVMAGALPTYLPVLIAGMQLLLDSEPGFCGFATYGFSTGSWAPFWIINGPIRNDIYVNNSSGALSPGDMANATIGRALGLLIKNMGGIRKGIEDMGVLGNPMKYTAVIAENEEGSPWEPLHVEHGLKKEDSAVTISYPQSFLQHWPYRSDDEGILRAIVNNAHHGQRMTLILPPPHASALARAGWTKKDVKEFISEYARQSNMMAATTTLFKGRIPVNISDTVRIYRDPEYIKIIVAGGPGAFIGHVVGGGATPGRKTTEKIQLPAKWGQLVEKYRNLVPTYIRY
jgi:hypothetical protein